MLILLLPFFILTFSTSGSNDQSMGFVLGIAGVCFGIFMFIYGIIMGLMLPAAYARVAVEDSIGAGLAFGEIFKMVKDNLAAYLLVLVGTIAASFISSLGSIACFVGIFVTAPYSFAIMGHLYGQAYLEAKEIKTF